MVRLAAEGLRVKRCSLGGCRACLRGGRGWLGLEATASFGVKGPWKVPRGFQRRYS